MTINELIVKIDTGTMTVEQAVDVIEAEKMTYGIEYFSPDTTQLTYWPMRREWQRRQNIKEQTKKIVELPAPEMKKCSCGHTVPLGLVMSASLGTSCPDCYDKMSN